MTRGAQDNGVAWDIIAEAIVSYDAWMQDDDYDAFGAINQIMGRLKKRASFYRGAAATERVRPDGEEGSKS